MRLIDGVKFWDTCFHVPLKEEELLSKLRKISKIHNPTEDDVVAALLKARGLPALEVYLITLIVRKFTRCGYDSEFFATYTGKLCILHEAGEQRHAEILKFADMLICRYHMHNNVRWVA